MATIICLVYWSLIHFIRDCVTLPQPPPSSQLIQRISAALCNKAGTKGGKPLVSTYYRLAAPVLLACCACGFPLLNPSPSINTYFSGHNLSTVPFLPLPTSSTRLPLASNFLQPYDSQSSPSQLSSTTPSLLFLRLIILLSTSFCHPTNLAATQLTTRNPQLSATTTRYIEESDIPEANSHPSSLPSFVRAASSSPSNDL